MKEITISKRMGMLADRLVTRIPARVTQHVLDEVVTVLRLGEGRILNLEQDVRVLQDALRKAHEENRAIARS